MTLVRIEPGSFTMGSTESQIEMLVKQFPDAKREFYDDEQPAHRVFQVFHRQRLRVLLYVTLIRTRVALDGQ